MIYNTYENIQYCKGFVDEVFGLLIYSHFFPIIAALVSLVIVLFSNTESLVKKVFFGFVTSFLLWVISNLAIWLFYDNNEVMLFAWSNIEVFSTALFIFLLYFVYILIYERDVSNKIKISWIILIAPIIILSFSKYHIVGVDLSECVAIENKIYLYYASFVKVLMSLWLIWILIKNVPHDKRKKKAVLVSGIGILIFFLSFLIMGYLASYTGNYNFEFYGLFGMLIFIVMLTFAVNRYKIINLKIISTELLVLGIVLLVSSQFLYLQNIFALVLNLFTFLFIVITGLLLIRNIKKEVEIRNIVQETAVQLEKINQNQQSLLHFVTHQIKGYLTKSRNIFDGMVAKDYGQLPPKAEEMAKYGFESNTRAVETVLAILKASDLKTGKTEFKKEISNVSALVADVIETRKDLAQEKNLDLTFDIEPEIKTQVDPIHIKEVFKNLITNAILYTQTGTVKVILKKESNQIKFSVIDTGVGLSESDKQKLFTEGGKGEEALKTNVDSTGYGLFVAKEIVLRHQGKIGAISEGRNKGSEFFVILPDIQ